MEAPEPTLLPDSAVALGRASVAPLAWRYRGELRVTLVTKVTLSFTPEGPMSRTAPRPVLRADVSIPSQKTLRSNRFASDLVPYKKAADVCFTGRAHAPGHAPGGSRPEQLSVRFGLFSADRALIDKQLLVRKKGGIESFPLDYEHALGGVGSGDNPFGEGFGEDAPPAELCIFDPVHPGRVGGLAPLAPSMDPRRKQRGALSVPTFGLDPVEVPDTLDFDYFQSAPVDQRTPLLRGDEWLVLENLHPRLPLLRSQLPSLRCAARIFGLADAGVADGSPLPMQMDTLHVSGDEELCLVSFRGNLTLPSPQALGRVRLVAGVESAGEPVDWSGAQAALSLPRVPHVAIRSGRPASSNETVAFSDLDPALSGMTLSASLPMGRPSRARATLPFRPMAGRAPTPVRRAPPEPSSGSDGATLPVPSRSGANPTLPFVKASAVDAPPAGAPAAGLPGAPAVAPAVTPAAVVAPLPPPEPAPEAPAVVSPSQGKVVWATPEPAPLPATKPPRPKREPPNVDVAAKLYPLAKNRPR